MTGDSQHRKIVKRIKIVFSDSSFTSGLLKRNTRNLKADLGDEPSEIRIGVVQCSQDIYDGSIVHPEARKMLEELHIRQFAHQSIVRGPYKPHCLRFSALLFHARDNPEPIFPSANHVGNNFWWIL